MSWAKVLRPIVQWTRNSKVVGFDSRQFCFQAITSYKLLLSPSTIYNLVPVTGHDALPTAAAGKVTVAMTSPLVMRHIIIIIIIHEFQSDASPEELQGLCHRQIGLSAYGLKVWKGRRASGIHSSMGYDTFYPGLPLSNVALMSLTKDIWV